MTATSTSRLSAGPSLAPVDLLEEPLPGAEPLTRIAREILVTASTMSNDEARYLVDTYYQVQDFRIASSNQMRQLEDGTDEDGGLAHPMLLWTFDSMQRVEGDIKRALERYARAHPIGQWALSITGIGPVIAAGLMAHIDIHKAPTVGHIWRFAGLDPTVEWGKGQKRPWNAKLKVLAWKAGESFVKVSGRPTDTYGQVYRARKALEEERNEAGLYAEQAARKLARFNIGKGTDAYAAYSQGKLPPAHIHARAKRYAVKLFLAHWHEAAYFAAFGKLPPKPYVLEHLGHVHFICAPNMEVIDGWAEARAAAGF